MSMASSQDTPVGEGELRRQVERLAVEVLTGSPAAGELRDAFDQIRSLAQRAGFAQTAAQALALIENLAAAHSPEAVSAGLARLQQVLDSELKPAKASAPVALAQDPELLADFVTEAREHLATIERQMLILEQNPAQVEAVHAVFRGFHTIKGLAGFLDLHTIRDVAHEVETVLDLVRNGQFAVTPALVDVVLAAADYLGQSVRSVEANLAGQPAPAVPGPETLLARVHGLKTTTTAPVEESVSVAAKSSSESEQAVSVRVDTSKLDHLMDMVGEMVIAQSLLVHDPTLTSLNNPRLQRNLSHLTRITGELQRTTMAVRMVPIGQLFQRNARVIRDMSRKAGKPVELEVSGQDTELDRNIVQSLGDPLLHMVRNSMDHGIESPAERARTGKPATGRIRLRASHQSGSILLEIGDDGRGLDREKILRKAVERGLVDSGRNLSDSEVFQLIFEPGFSTAEKVTDVSGRGVGMDVVRRQVQKMRGRIEINSTLGRGTTFLIKLPLTLAIVDGLVIGVGQHRYIMPLFAVREVLKPTPGSVHTLPNGAEMALVRQNLLPLRRLHRRFGVQPRSSDVYQSLLLVLEGQGKCFCLVVDDLIGKQEVVIKSLGEAFKTASGLAGGAILGDGRVGLILDVEGVFGTGSES